MQFCGGGFYSSKGETLFFFVEKLFSFSYIFLESVNFMYLFVIIMFLNDLII